MTREIKQQKKQQKKKFIKKNKKYREKKAIIENKEKEEEVLSLNVQLLCKKSSSQILKQIQNFIFKKLGINVNQKSTQIVQIPQKYSNEFKKEKPNYILKNYRLNDRKKINFLPQQYVLRNIIKKMASNIDQIAMELEKKNQELKWKAIITELYQLFKQKVIEISLLKKNLKQSQSQGVGNNFNGQIQHGEFKLNQKNQEREQENVDVNLLTKNDLLNKKIALLKMVKQKQSKNNLKENSKKQKRQLNQICSELSRRSSNKILSETQKLINKSFKIAEGQEYSQKFQIPEELYKWFTQENVNQIKYNYKLNHWDNHKQQLNEQQYMLRYLISNYCIKSEKMFQQINQMAIESRKQSQSHKQQVIIIELYQLFKTRIIQIRPTIERQENSDSEQILSNIYKTQKNQNMELSMQKDMKQEKMKQIKSKRKELKQSRKQKKEWKKWAQQFKQIEQMKLSRPKEQKYFKKADTIVLAARNLDDTQQVNNEKQSNQHQHQ